MTTRKDLSLADGSELMAESRQSLSLPTSGKFKSASRAPRSCPSPKPTLKASAR